MITKEKHFTKCETPNSSRIIEDKKHPRLANGLAEPADTKRAPALSSPLPKDKPDDKPDEKRDTKDADKPKEGSADDANVAYNAPKYGTVIPNRIFVGGFSAKTTDEDLWRFFSSFSHITAAKIIYDRTGVSKCYGFVTFANPKDSKMIVKQSGGVMYSPMGRLRIAQAVRKQVPHYQTLPPEFTQLAPPEGYYGPPQKPQQVCMMPAQAPQQAAPHMRGAAQTASPPSSTAASSESGPQPYPPELYLPTYVLPPSLPAYDATGLYTTCPGYAQPLPPYPYVVLPAPAPRELAPYYPPAPMSYAPPACYPQELHPKLPLLNSYIY